MSVIHFGLFPGVKLTAKVLEEIIESTPIISILQDIINLNEQEYAGMGNKSWKELFKDFLKEKNMK